MQWLFVHNMLMVGAPGAGKTLLARALPAILPRILQSITSIKEANDEHWDCLPFLTAGADLVQIDWKRWKYETVRTIIPPYMGHNGR